VLRKIEAEQVGGALARIYQQYGCDTVANSVWDPVEGTVMSMVSDKVLIATHEKVTRCSINAENNSQQFFR